MDVPLFNTDTANITDYLNHIDALESSLRQCQYDLEYIEKCQKRALELHIDDKEAYQNKDFLETATNQTKKNLNAFQKHLAVLEKQLLVFRKGSSDFVMCANHLSKLRKKYSQFLKAFYSLQKSFSEKQKDRLLKEMQVIDPSATMNDIHLSQPSPLFKQAFLQSNQYTTERALSDVKERHQELKVLEASVVELADMMTELSLHIETQDGFIEQINRDAEDAVGQLEYGEKQLDGAIRRRQSCIRCKWYLCCFCILVIIGLILYLVFYVFEVHRSNPSPPQVPAAQPNAPA